MSAEQAREERAYATGIQAALWGRPLVLYLKTLHAGLTAGAVGMNYYRKYSELKTAKDKFVNTPNNVVGSCPCQRYRRRRHRCRRQ